MTKHPARGGARSAGALLLACGALAAGASSLGCGKKGPPLPPLPGSVPRVSDMALRQEGREVRASFSLPRRPGELELDYAILGMELWRRPTEIGRQGLENEEDLGLRDFTDDAVQVAEVSGDDLFELMKTAPELVDPLSPDVYFTEVEYAVVLRTSVRKRGTLSNVALFVPRPPPSPPDDVRVEAREGQVTIAWSIPEPPPPLPPDLAPEADDEPLAAEPPPQAGEPPPAEEPEPQAAEPLPEAEETEGGPPAEEVLPDAAPAADAASPEADEPLPPAPPEQRFNVYRATGEGPWGIAPLNGEPLGGTQLVDADVVPGTTYRYRLRTVIREADRVVLSEPSIAAELDYRDVFAPAPPTGLRTIVEGTRAVGLVWNPSAAPDVGGYGVYRRLRGTETWNRLDRGDVETATYSDSTVEPGLTYEYAVTAYDTTDPPNESERSEAQQATVPDAAPR